MSVQINLNNSANVVGLHIGDPHGNVARHSYQKWLLSHVQTICSLAEKYEYHLEQRNGQRIFGPPIKYHGEKPPGNCEIFIGRIPKDIFEDTLVPLLTQYGQLYQLRLMMDFSGNNRGFAFATFFSYADAVRTCQLLDNYEITPGKFLGVVQSQDNKDITLSNVPFSENIANILCAYTVGVLDVKISKENGNSSGHVQVRVTYEDHRAAALARRFLMQSAMDIFNSNRFILVDWTYRITRHHQNYHPVPRRPNQNQRIDQH